MQPLTMTECPDRLLQDPSAWKEVKQPRADGSHVRAVALRVQASRREAVGVSRGHLAGC